ncbi:MAG: hypothetical protein MRY83_20970 [Flavobacteriales bacterium]|nr:hypothetical protein [Flavobacteriales bacterium]
MLYLLIPFCFFTTIGLFGRKNFTSILGYIKDKLSLRTSESMKIQIQSKDKKFSVEFDVIKTIIFLTLGYFIYQWFGMLFSRAIVGHDMLEYAIQAKYFADQKVIEYVQNRFHPQNNFFYVGLHGFAYPLLGSWEFLVADTLNLNSSDFYFRSATGYYGFLLGLLQFYWLKKVSQKLAIIGSILLFLTLGILLSITDYHIDMFRIFMISASMSLLAQSVKNKNSLEIVALGLFLGAQAFIHSLGVFIACFVVFSFLLFYPESISVKIRKTALITALVMAAGGIHYVVDVLFGTGWIFQEIIYY